LAWWDPISTDQIDPFACLERRYTVAIDFLFVDPAGPVEGRGDLGSVHQAESNALSERRRGHYFESTMQGNVCGDARSSG